MTQTYANYAPSSSPPAGLFQLNSDYERDEFDDEPEVIPAETALQVLADEPAVHEPDEPIAPAGAVGLRPYQEDAIKCIYNQFNKGAQSTLVVAATGTGKTVTFAELTRRTVRHQKGVLLLVHRDELVRQIVRSCGRTGVYCAVEKSSERAQSSFGTLAHAVCASVQTLQGKRLEQWPRDTFSLIITDEAHHSTAATYRRVYDHFERARRVGFTATADRLDGAKLGEIYETLAYEYNLLDAVRDGWLVPIVARTLKTNPPVDLRDLRVTGGDFNLGDLEDEIQSNIGVLVNAVRDTDALENRRTIAFTPSIGSAAALAAALSDVGIKARAVAGNSPDRADLLAAHQRGDFQVLVNCQILTEGYDDPAVSCILLCRPTKSRALYSQMVGRGTRLHPDSGKTNCKIVDFAFLTKMPLVTPVELYDKGDVPDAVLDRARELMESDVEREWGLDEAIEAAGVEIDEARRVKIQRRAVGVQAREFDPLTACEIFDVPMQKAAYEWENTVPASDSQVDALNKWGIAATADIGKATASKLLNKLHARKEHGWTAPRQINDLMAQGLTLEAARGMRANDAKSLIDNGAPSDKQKKFLKWKGVPDADIAGMTRKQASERISALNA